MSSFCFYLQTLQLCANTNLHIQCAVVKKIIKVVTLYRDEAAVVCVFILFGGEEDLHAG